MAEKKQSEILERVYTVPLRQSFRNAPKYRKTNRAVGAVRAFLERHMKSDDVRLGQHLNELLWARGIGHPPPRVTVKATRDEEGVVRAELDGKAYKESVRPVPKEEQGSLKEKLANTFRKDDGKGVEKEAKPKGDAPSPKAPASPKRPEKVEAA